MPGRDQKGPLGMGPMSGKRFGVCGGHPMPYYGNQGLGQGYGQRFGFRHGRRTFTGPHLRRSQSIPNYQTPYGFEPDIQNEKEHLQNEAKFLEDALTGIKNRIDELEVSSNK